MRTSLSVPAQSRPALLFKSLLVKDDNKATFLCLGRKDLLLVVDTYFFLLLGEGG